MVLLEIDERVTGMSENKVHPAWDRIDGILVINLDAFPERMQAFISENEGRIPTEKVHRLVAVDGRKLPGYGEPPWFMPRTMERAYFWGGTAGCALSHRRAIERAKMEGWRNVLVLEDDVRVLDEQGALRIMQYALDNLKGKYMLYLGYSRPTPYGRKVYTEDSHSLWKTEGVLAGYGYLVPQSMYDTILAMMPTEEDVWEWLSIYRAVDSFYRDNVAALPGVSIYMVQPDLIEHVDGISSIAATYTSTEHFSKTQQPYSYASPAGMWHLLTYPLRRLKIYLNSIRTHRRALRGGFPGHRKKKK